MSMYRKANNSEPEGVGRDKNSGSVKKKRADAAYYSLERERG